MSDASEARIKELLEAYPKSKSVVMPALHMAQQEHKYLTEDAVRWVAKTLDLPLAHVMGVATFYTMYYKEPVGTYHIQICRTLSCMLCGARKLTSYIKERLNVKPGEITENGLWSYEEVECLGSCGTAPMVEINDVYFENLTPESLGALMDEIEKESPDLRYSDAKQELGKGLPERPRSEVW